MNTKIAAYTAITDYKGLLYVFTTLTEEQAKKFLSEENAHGIKAPAGLIAMISTLSESYRANLNKTLDIIVKAEILFESVKEYKIPASEALAIKSSGLDLLMRYAESLGEHCVVVTDIFTPSGRIIYVSESLKKSNADNH